MANTKALKKQSNLKQRILAKFADTEIYGASKSGLMTKALNRIDDLLANHDPELYEKGIDKFLKLLPYVLPKIGYDKPLIANNGSNTAENSYTQVNIYLEERLKTISKPTESGISTTTQEIISEPQPSQDSTPDSSTT